MATPPTAAQLAFQASWFEPKNHKYIVSASRQFAHPPVGPDDLYQRAFLHLWASAEPPTGRDVVYAATDAMRHFRGGHFRLHGVKTTDRGVEVEEAVPASRPTDAEGRATMKERIEKALPMVEQRLGDTPRGKLAYAVLLKKLQGVDDCAQLAQELSATRTQIYEATRLAVPALEAVVAELESGKKEKHT
jgi:hypothetical protein